MRKYRSTDGTMTATMELLPFSRNEFVGSHVYTEVAGCDRSHRYNWEVSGNYASACDWLVREFGCGWLRVRG